MRIDNSSKAGLTLAAAVAGFCLSYPWQYSFWGGLVHSGFGAAMVGGLADWYAVTALFRRPLNIPFRTAIIPKNRERIFSAIVAMVEEEIITAANIKDTLAKAGLARLLLSCANRPEARQQLQVLTEDVLREAATGIRAVELSAALDRLLAEHPGRVQAAPLAGQALRWSIEHGFADKCIDFLITEGKRLLGEPYMTKLIADIYRGALNSYAARHGERKLVKWILQELLKLDPVNVAVIIQKKTAAWLEAIYDQEHPLRERLRDWAVTLADGLQTDPVLAEKAEMELRPLVVRIAGQLAELPASQPEMLAGGSKWAVRQAMKLADEFVGDPERQAGFDNYLADWISRWVGQNHGEIGRIVSAYLESFSNDDLVHYIEDKVKDDLQMIRINGSVVGGFVGMILFVIAYVAGVTP